MPQVPHRCQRPSLRDASARTIFRQLASADSVGTCPLFARAVDSVISNTTANILQTQWTQAPAAFNYPALISAIDTSALCICSPSMDFANMITSATPWIKGGGQYDMEDGDAMGSFITHVLKGSSMCSSP